MGEHTYSMLGNALERESVSKKRHVVQLDSGNCAEGIISIEPPSLSDTRSNLYPSLAASLIALPWAKDPRGSNISGYS